MTNRCHFSDCFERITSDVTELDMAASRRGLRCLRSGLWSIFFIYVYSYLELVFAEDVDSCDNLNLGQYPLLIVY